jgi:hypothetical protein
MKGFSGLRFWLETVMASITGVLFVVTLVWRDWIEEVFGVDPDAHSGSLEWIIVAVCLVSAVVLSSLARSEWRKLQTVSSL